MDAHAFLSATRGCFEAFEIYPQNFTGIFGVVRDRIVLAKEGLNLLSTKYAASYSEKNIRVLAAGIRELEVAVSLMEKAVKADANITITTLDELLSGITGVNVWGLVDTSQTPNYQTISTTQSPDWSEVA